MDLLKNIFKGDKVIWIIFLLLCFISIVEVFSAASTLTYVSGDHWAPITGHFLMLLGGAIIVVLMHNIPYRWFQMFPFFLYPVSLVLLIVVMLMGFVSDGRVNGAARWLNIMGIQFQPSELAKMALVIAVSSVLSMYQEEDGANGKAFKIILGLTLPVCLFIAPENLSTAGLLFGVVLLMMFIGRVAMTKLASLLAVIFAVVSVGVVTLLIVPNDTNVPLLHRGLTWKNRIMKFTSKEEVPAAKFDIDKDAQVAHARIAIATSRVIGKGPGNSIERDFLSQAYSDFIFAIIIEELGLLGGVCVVILYIWLLMRAGKIARRCERTFPAFLVMGIALMLVSQALLNMMVAVGLFPVTGQPLPLISKGGTATFINCAYIGMILSVSRYTAELEARKAAEGEQKLLTAVATEGSQLMPEPKSEALNNDAVFAEDEEK